MDLSSRDSKIFAAGRRLSEPSSGIISHFGNESNIIRDPEVLAEIDSLISRLPDVNTSPFEKEGPVGQGQGNSSNNSASSSSGSVSSSSPPPSGGGSGFFGIRSIGSVTSSLKSWTSKK